MIIVVVIVAILLLIALLWLAGFLIATDFAVPSRDTRRFQHVLAIFPHADDEAITCAGLLRRVARAGGTTTLVLLTRGERGISQHALEPGGRDIRVGEARRVAAILGISRLIQEDFGDGLLPEKRQGLKLSIADLIKREKPDLIITYDLSGLYGHMDHIVCSEIVTELKKTSFPEIPLWYATFPRRILAWIKPPRDMYTDPHMREKRALPTHKVFIAGGIFPKIRAWYAYQSQRASLRKGIGILLPLWFLLSMLLFEYFAEVR